MLNLPHKQFGFSVIELLTTIAMAGILLVIAIPNYIKYSNQAKITEALLALDEYKMRTIKIIAKTGAAPSSTDILYPDGNTTGRIDDNNKTIAYKYVDRVYANIVSGSVLLGVRLIPSGNITASNNYVYLAYQSNRWNCGTSATMSNNVDSSILPTVCNKTLP